MNMILALTPNPALDLSGCVERLMPNEKNYVSDETRNPGGTAINVARFLTRLKVPVTASGFLGMSVGREVRSLLDREKVRHDFVEISGHTRISLTISNLKSHQQTRLSFPGPRVKSGEIQSLISKAKKFRHLKMLILGGSFPPGFQVSHANRLIAEAHRKNVPVVVDVPGEILRRLPLTGLLLIKPNLTEFQDLIGRQVTSITTIGHAARKLASKVGLVCVSSVEGGAILASRDFVWFGRPPNLKIKSTVGAGDSMVAGMTAELWRRGISVEMCNDESLMPELLRQSLSAAAATLSTSGTNLGSAEVTRKFRRDIVVRKLHI